MEDWKSYNEDEIFLIVKEFEKKPRDEGSSWYERVLSDKKLAANLLKIANKYPENIKMNVYIVSALGNMIKRYKLEPFEEIFNYFLKNAKKRNCFIWIGFFYHICLNLRNMTRNGNISCRLKKLHH